MRIKVFTVSGPDKTMRGNKSQTFSFLKRFSHWFSLSASAVLGCASDFQNFLFQCRIICLKFWLFPSPVFLCLKSSLNVRDGAWVSLCRCNVPAGKFLIPVQSTEYGIIIIIIIDKYLYIYTSSHKSVLCSTNTGILRRQAPVWTARCFAITVWAARVSSYRQF